MKFLFQNVWLDVQETLPLCSWHICIGACWLVNSKQHKYWYTMLSLPHTFSLVLSKSQKERYNPVQCLKACLFLTSAFWIHCYSGFSSSSALPTLLSQWAWACTYAHFSLSIFVTASKRSASCFITVFLYCAVKIDGRKVGGGFWSESAYMFLLSVLHQTIYSSKLTFTQAYYKNKLNKTLQPDRRKNKKIRTTKKSREIKKKKKKNFKLLSSYINWLIVFEK